MNQMLKDLIDQYVEIVHSPENQQKKGYWSRVDSWNRDKQRPTPKKNKAIPFVIAPDNSFFCNVINFSMYDYYKDPEKHLEYQLRIKLYHHENFKDNFLFYG